MTEMMKKKKTKMAMSSSSTSSSSSSCLFSLAMEEDIIIDKILLKLPVSSLLRLRCVSRYFHSLITSPSFINKHLHHHHHNSTHQLNHNNNNLLLISSRFIHVSSYGLNQVYRHRVFNFCNGDPSCPEVVEMHCPFEYTGIQASCNGLLFLHKFSTKTTDYIWNPCTKEYKEIPLPPRPSPSRRTTHGPPQQPFQGSRGIQGPQQPFQGLQQPFQGSTLPRRIQGLQQQLPSQGFQACSSGFRGFGYDCTNDEYKIFQGLQQPFQGSTMSRRIQGSQQPFQGRIQGLQQQQQPSRGVQACSSGFCGFGYDCTNDEYKILYYENSVNILVNCGVSISEYKLYKLRTNTWTSVRDNPYRHLTFGLYQNIGMFVNGALHWIMSPSQLLIGRSNARIISFDMEKEEFREIPKPLYRSTAAATTYGGGLQVLQGCLCLSEFSSDLNTTYIWILKDYAVRDSWTKLFTVAVPRVEDSLAKMHLKLLRLCENGEIVMSRNHQYGITGNGGMEMDRKHHNDMIVYDPVKHIFRRVENLDETIKKHWTYEVIYTESLVSLNSGTYMS